MNALEIKNLYKQYDGFALDHLNLTLPAGCIMGLIGENGAGKSTTIKLILDMIRSDGGQISIYGKDTKNNVLLREDIGVVLDEVGISEALTAPQVGQIMQHIFQSWDTDVYSKLVRRLAIPEKKRFKDFSRGMKMKLGIAIALSHHAKLLILDEATSGLDPVVRDEVTDMLCEFTRAEDHAVLISSHIISDLEKICDYIAFLHQGKLMLCEEKDVLREQYGVIHISNEDAQSIPASALVGMRKTDYGTEAIAKRNAIPAGIDVSPVDLEQLFVYMVKKEA